MILAERIYCDQVEERRTFPDLDTARAHAHAAVKTYDGWLLCRIHDDGTVAELEWINYTPKPYAGELVRVTLDISGQNAKGMFHRTPIECWRVSTPGRPITDVSQMRVVDKDPGHGDWMGCTCGSWVTVEGTPEKIAELTARYPEIVT